MKKLFLIKILVFAALYVNAQVSDEHLFNILKQDDLNSFQNIFSEERINDPYRKDSITLLTFAVFNKSNTIVQYLIEKGADVNKESGGLTPLMWASRVGNYEGLRLLIDNAARINETDDDGNSALIYAASIGCFNCIKILLSQGADVNQVNDFGKDAEFYSRRAQHTEVTKLIRLAKIEDGALGDDLSDGPHIQWLENNRVNISYFFYTANKQKVKLKQKKIKIKGPQTIISGLFEDDGQYIIERNYKAQPAIYNDVDSVFVIGDIHGNYHQTIELLQNSGVIDSNNSWQWEKGHLVFIGDIFDRGDQVTETLWFIKNLEKQALEAGGRVHFLYGNHEIMNLEGDDRYISDKYLYFSKKLNFRHAELYQSDYELGRWLRSLNTIVKIDSMLFVHAGISPQLYAENISIEEINEKMREYLSQDSFEQDSIHMLLTGRYGPLWYRGFIKNYYENELISEKEFNEITNFYGVNRIVFGHTPDETFRTEFNNRLIGVDVSSSSNYENEKALMIKGDGYYKIFLEGRREKL